MSIDLESIDLDKLFNKTISFITTNNSTYIPILKTKSQFENLRVLSSTEGSDKIIIRRNYYPEIDLTMRSVAELLLK